MMIASNQTANIIRTKRGLTIAVTQIAIGLQEWLGNRAKLN